MEHRTAGSAVRFAAGVALGLSIATGAACTTSAKKDVAKTALDAMSPAERRETFEATCRVLDEHPELVDELYSVARVHRPLLDRLFTNATKDLEERPMAELAATHIVQNPPALEQTMKTSIDVISKHPEARAALNRAMVSRAELGADILTDSPTAVSRMLQATLLVLDKKPAARRSALVAVRRNRQRIIAFMKNDPELVRDVSEELLSEVVKDKPALEKALRAAKVLPEEPRKQ